MVARDSKTWDTRGQIARADLAISPQNPQTLLATTRQGLTRSTDGGRSFGPVPGAPLLQLVTWIDTGSVVGLTPEGAMYISGDGATTWSQRGTAGGAGSAHRVRQPGLCRRRGQDCQQR